MFRAGLHLDTGAYASYGLNPTPQSPIGSECVDVKNITYYIYSGGSMLIFMQATLVICELAIIITCILYIYMI